jgi:hypothetical protein
MSSLQARDESLYYKEVILLMQRLLKRQLDAVDGFKTVNEDGVILTPEAFVNAINILTEGKIGDSRGRR